MNQAELIDSIVAQSQRGLSKTAVKEALDGLATIVQSRLAEGGEVTLPGLGKLSVTRREGRTGRNPQTGESIEIAAKNAPKFSAAKALKDAINA